MRRCSGICPPSKPRRREYPRRDFCPLFPAPAVLPSLEPIPRPTRTFFLREPFGGRKLERLGDLRTGFSFSAIIIPPLPRDAGPCESCPGFPGYSGAPPPDANGASRDL